MARTILASQAPPAAGVAPTYAAADAAEGMQFTNSGNTIIHVKNGGAGALTVTVPTPGAVDGLQLDDRTIAVPAGAERVVCLRNERLYRQADGSTHLNFSTGTSVTVAAFEGGAA